MKLRAFLFGFIVALSACSNDNNEPPELLDDGSGAGNPELPAAPPPVSGPAPMPNPQPAPGPMPEPEPAPQPAPQPEPEPQPEPGPEPEPEPGPTPPPLGPSEPINVPPQPTFPGTFINGATVDSLQTLWVCTEPGITESYGLGFSGAGDVAVVTTDDIGSLMWAQDGDEIVLSGGSGADAMRLTAVSFPNNDRMMFSGAVTDQSVNTVVCDLEAVGADGPRGLIQPAPPPSGGSTSPFVNTLNSEGRSTDAWACGFADQFVWTIVLAPSGVGILLRSGDSEFTNLTWSSDTNTTLTLMLADGVITIDDVNFSGSSNFVARTVTDLGTPLTNVSCRIVPL